MKRKSPNLTPEQRAAFSERCRRMNADPEIQARRIANTRKANARRIDKLREIAADMRRSPKRIINLRVKLKKLWSDKDYRKRMKLRMKAYHRDPEFVAKNRASKQTPEFRAKISRIARRTRDRERGFKIPPAKREEYDRLLKIKRFTAQEAGQILGLI